MRCMYANRPHASSMRMPINLSWLLLAGTLIFSLAACSQNAASAPASPTPRSSLTASPQVQSTSTTPPQGTVIYQADWSHGFAGWQGSSGWSVAHGQLLVNSLHEASIVVPYQPAVPNFAIEFRVQLVHVLTSAGNMFMLYAKSQPQKDGYGAGFVSLEAPKSSENVGQGFYSGFAQVSTDTIEPNSVFSPEIDFVPGLNWRTYRLEVQGNEVSFYIDGTRSGFSTSAEEALSNGPLSLDARGLLVRVSSFRITTL